MQIKITVEQDAEALSCDWSKVTDILRDWAVLHAAHPSFPPEVKQDVPVSLELKTEDIISAINELHQKLYDCQVNFTVSVD